jgi:sulfate permease, SulP family
VTVLARQAREFRGLLPGRADLRLMGRSPRRDLVAGLTVAVVALPLALAFGVASGLGARAGLITAIVAGSVAAVFGGSNLQVSGPTGAMTVVLVPIVHEYGINGVLTVGLLAGGLLMLAGIAKLGRVVRYLPAPVIEGFTAGIAGVIILQQVPVALGVSGHGSKPASEAYDSMLNFLHHPGLVAPLMAASVALLILLAARFRPGLPASLLAVVLASVVAKVAHLDVTGIGHLPAGIAAPSLGFLQLRNLGSFLPAAVAVAALGALESLLSATVADGMTVGQRHDSDRELFGQGLANVVSPLFGGMPATAAIARTAVNVRAGATSRLAALSHALILAAIVMLAAPMVSVIPLAALAGVLIATCIQMVEVGALRALLRASRPDALVLLVTFGVTLAVDLVTAVVAGIVVAGVLALRAMASSTQVEQEPLDATDHSDEEQALLEQHIIAYRIDGPLFFAGAHRFLLEMSEVGDVRVVILRLSRMTTLDTTGAAVLGDAITRLEHRGILVLLSGLRPSHREMLETLGIARHLEAEGRIHADTPSAIACARGLIVPPD